MESITVCSRKVKEILVELAHQDHDLLDRTVIVSPTEEMNGHEIGDALEKALTNVPHHSDCEICQAYVYFNRSYEGRVWGELRKLGLENNAKISGTERGFYPEIYNWPSGMRFWDKAVEKYLQV